MILYQWRGAHRNFGDELNSLLWPRLLPDFFDQDEATRFLGIGSILDNRHDATPLKLVAGSGYGGYQPQIVLDESWIIHWVRGERTARLLGLPTGLGIGDPASLLPLTGLTPEHEDRDIGFIPHFESAARGAWQEVAAKAGVTLIDPREDPLTVIAAIGKCRVVMSEALHGVIVADALRVPWIAIRPLAPIHRPKWFDWAETLDLKIEFAGLLPSTALERAHLTHLSRFHLGRRVLHHQAARLHDIARQRHIDRAALALRAVTRAEPQLSRSTLLQDAQARMMEKIAALRRQPMGGCRANASAAPSASLHGNGVCAYQDVPGRQTA
ncbi:MAG TPA: polysaccharide pyruvyl transferase family protein [Acetobacteraceae bacterium]|nr:polysaccharide pyruvyl transferase family protein [Acetobacteraceae bacterium]